MHELAGKLKCLESQSLKQSGPVLPQSYNLIKCCFAAKGKTENNMGSGQKNGVQSVCLVARSRKEFQGGTSSPFLKSQWYNLLVRKNIVHT